MNPRASVVFSQDAFGGDGDPMSGCVVDGPFAGWSTTYQTPHCLRRRINGTVWTSSAQMAAFISATTDCKFRSLFSGFQPCFLEYCIDTYILLVAFFSSNFERTSHGQIHRQIGGDMFTTEVSANDPLFWVHHANVDRYFLIWQVQHPNSGYSSRDGILETDTLLPFNLPLSYGMIRPDQSVDYCYEYSSSVQPATDQGLALRKRSQSPARLELRYPPHLPDDWLRMMRFSVPETHAFEKRTERFTDLLNAVEFPAPSLVVEQQRAGSKGPIEWEPVKNPLWRFTTEDLAMLKEAWRVAGEMK